MVSTDRLETGSLSAVHWLAVALAAVTGAMHVSVGVVDARAPLVLAGLGFFGAVGLFLADYRRQLLYPFGVAYTGLQIAVWAVVNAGSYTAVGYVDKAVQVVLLVLLAYLYWTGRAAARRPRTSAG